MSRISENRELLKNKNVRAALEMISKSEGTNGDYNKMVYGTVVKSPLYPSLVGKKNVSIPNLSRFPDILVRVNSKGLQSSAAGKYQILKKTYADAAAALGVSDFSAETQDLIAVELIRRRGAMGLIVKGDMAVALTKTSLPKEWASFAGAGYGQGEHSIDKLVGWFKSAAGVIAENPEAAGGISLGVIAAAAMIFF